MTEVLDYNLEQLKTFCDNYIIIPKLDDDQSIPHTKHINKTPKETLEYINKKHKKYYLKVSRKNICINFIYNDTISTYSKKSFKLVDEDISTYISSDLAFFHKVNIIKHKHGRYILLKYDYKNNNFKQNVYNINAIQNDVIELDLSENYFIKTYDYSQLEYLEEIIIKSIKLKDLLFSDYLKYDYEKFVNYIYKHFGSINSRLYLCNNKIYTIEINIEFLKYIFKLVNFAMDLQSIKLFEMSANSMIKNVSSNTDISFIDNNKLYNSLLKNIKITYNINPIIYFASKIYSKNNYGKPMFLEVASDIYI